MRAMVKTWLLLACGPQYQHFVSSPRKVQYQICHPYKSGESTGCLVVPTLGDGNQPISRDFTYPLWHWQDIFLDPINSTIFLEPKQTQSDARHLNVLTSLFSLAALVVVLLAKWPKALATFDQRWVPCLDLVLLRCGHCYEWLQLQLFFGPSRSDCFESKWFRLILPQMWWSFQWTITIRPQVVPMANVVFATCFGYARTMAFLVLKDKWRFLLVTGREPAKVCRNSWSSQVIYFFVFKRLLSNIVYDFPVQGNRGFVWPGNSRVFATHFFLDPTHLKCRSGSWYGISFLAHWSP